MYLQTGPGVIDLILQKLLTYPKINKPKGFEKTITSVFSKVRFLCNCLRVAIIPNKDIWDSIAIVMVIDSLHKDFNLITSGLLGQREDKTIDKIQQILFSAKAKFISKQKVGITANLAHMSRNNKPSYSQKQKTTLNDESYNCHKIEHFGRDCRMQDFRLAKRKASDTRQDDAPRFKQHQLQLRRANVVADHKEENSNPEPFHPRTAFMTIEQPKMTKAKSTWYLDSCASHHLTNNRNIF